jgi:hypothetical protein
MKKLYAILLLIIPVLLLYGDEPEHAITHEVEGIVFDFIKDVKDDVYSENIYFFESDTELTKEDREHYFRRLEKFVRNNIWDLYFTSVEIWEGNEDLADVILMAESGDIVVFILGFWYDTERWELDGYEFPALTYDRPEDQTYEEYIQQIIDDAKADGVTYSKRGTIGDNGLYYIEYK